MKKDSEVKLYMQARKTGKSQKLASAAAGMSERTGRKYERMGTLPSQLKQPRTWLTRKNPFEQDWEWVVAQLERTRATRDLGRGLPCPRHRVSRRARRILTGRQVAARAQCRNRNSLEFSKAQCTSSQALRRSFALAMWPNATFASASVGGRESVDR